MPHGKPAGARCVQLDAAGRCRIFGDPRRPAVCASLSPSREMCGDDAAEALAWLTRLEADTATPAVTGTAAGAAAVSTASSAVAARLASPGAAPDPSHRTSGP